MMQVAELLKALQAQGRTVYVITHDPELICECCTDMIRMEAGSIAEHYPLDDAGVQNIRQFFRMQAPASV